MKGAYEITPLCHRRTWWLYPRIIILMMQNGIDHELKEVFYTISRKGVIRAMHFQLKVKQQAACSLYKWPCV